LAEQRDAQPAVSAVQVAAGDSVVQDVSCGDGDGVGRVRAACSVAQQSIRLGQIAGHRRGRVVLVQRHGLDLAGAVESLYHAGGQEQTADRAGERGHIACDEPAVASWAFALISVCRVFAELPFELKLKVPVPAGPCVPVAP